MSCKNRNMKVYTSALAGVMFLALVLSSCQKYKDGPPISVIPRKDRVANTWEISHAVQHDTVITGNFNYYTLYLTREGSAELSAKYTLNDDDYLIDTHGTWEF